MKIRPRSNFIGPGFTFIYCRVKHRIIGDLEGSPEYWKIVAGEKELPGVFLKEGLEYRLKINDIIIL